jgi:peptide methionine sulfoxide reductase MsrA
MFWKSHSPTRTQSSVQYRCVVFCHDDKQKKLALESKEREASKRQHSITTAVDTMANTKFTFAEDYHQKFYLRNNRTFFSFFEEMPLEKFIDCKSFDIVLVFVLVFVVVVVVFCLTLLYVR